MARLRLQIGEFHESKGILATWDRAVHDFPKAFRYKGSPWEWDAYDQDETGKADIVLYFSPVPHYQMGVYAGSLPDLERLPGLTLFGGSVRGECQCGAAFSPFGFDHMRFCPMHDPGFWNRGKS